MRQEGQTAGGKAGFARLHTQREDGDGGSVVEAQAVNCREDPPDRPIAAADEYLRVGNDVRVCG